MKRRRRASAAAAETKVRRRFRFFAAIAHRYFTAALAGRVEFVVAYTADGSFVYFSSIFLLARRFNERFFFFGGKLLFLAEDFRPLSSVRISRATRVQVTALSSSGQSARNSPPVESHSDGGYEQFGFFDAVSDLRVVKVHSDSIKSAVYHWQSFKSS